MPRPYTDITLCKGDQPIKNGTILISTTFHGNYNTLDTYVKNTPDIDTIKSKYGNRFYNGIFVQLVGDQLVVGG